MTGKLFGVGLSKTGTTSLHLALLELGVDSVHFHQPMVSWDVSLLRKVIASAISQVVLGARVVELAQDWIYDPAHLKMMWDELEKHEAFLDTPVGFAWREIAARYPQAKFILTTRDVDSWLNSAQRFSVRQFRIPIWSPQILFG